LIRDEASVLQRLNEYLGLSESEAKTYIKAVKEGEVTDGEVKSLLARGMLIRSADEKVYLPVHPRLALSNLFRSRTDKGSAEMREKRKLIDKLTLELIPAYDARRNSR
jgi:hypothetical protein